MHKIWVTFNNAPISIQIYSIQKFQQQKIKLLQILWLEKLHKDWTALVLVNRNPHIAGLRMELYINHLDTYLIFTNGRMNELKYVNFKIPSSRFKIAVSPSQLKLRRAQMEKVF